MVISRLDYCDSFYTGLPLILTQKLQLVQIAVAQVLNGTLLRAHIQLVLCQLHWLQIEYKIRFKYLVITFKALNDLGPTSYRTTSSGILLKEHYTVRRKICCLSLAWRICDSPQPEPGPFQPGGLVELSA